MFAYENFLSIENELFIQMYILYCISTIKDLNALNRMLTFYFALRIDWYTDKGQISNTMNKHIDVSLRSIARRDNIGSVHELIFNNQSAAQQNRTVL